MDARRWAPGDLAFQGGTSLHLAYGSARFSEDVDFMVREGVPLRGLGLQVQKRIRLPSDISTDLSLTVTRGVDPRNPHVFHVTLGGVAVVGSAKVRVELWQTDADALRSLEIAISTVRSPAGQAFVPTLTLQEIFVDKIYALGARDRVKARDVFDLWWLCQKGPTTVNRENLHTRLRIYPAKTEPRVTTAATATRWLATSKDRLRELTARSTSTSVATDLTRWLPPSWRMTEAMASDMLAPCIEWLNTGRTLMKELASPSRATT
jgi:predicted nucleotidyltransferase component of viral defense system